MYFTCGSLSIWTVLGLDILSHVNFLFSRVFSHVKRGVTLDFRCGDSKLLPLTSLFKDASFSPLPILQRVIGPLQLSHHVTYFS